MYKDCKTPQSIRRQLHVVLCLAEMIQAQPYCEITVSRLCQQAGVPRKAFYRYFDTKEDVFHALIDHLLDEYEQFAPPYQPGEERCAEKDMEKFFLFWLQHHALLCSLLQSGLGGSLTDHVVLRSLERKTGAARSAFGEEPGSFRLMIGFTVGGLFRILFDWCEGGFRQPPHEIAAIVSRLLSHPVFAPSSLK